MQQAYFEFQTPPRLLAGALALEHIPHELRLLGARRPLLISDAGLVRTGLLALCERALREGETPAQAVWTDVPPDSSISLISRIAGTYRESGCDSVVAVGGGSVLDTAKGVCMVIAHGARDLSELMGCEAMPRGAHVPFIAVPTTAGTGSEATAVAVVRDDARALKMEFISGSLLPDAAVLDPRMTRTLPPRITAATGMDALCHAVEAYSCLQHNPISDTYARGAIEMIARSLIPAAQGRGGDETRMEMACAATMAGAAFSNAMVGLVHAVGHALGGVCRVPHGEAMAILLPHCMRFNLKVCAARYGDMLLPMAGPEVYARTPEPERAAAVIDRIEAMLTELNAVCGLPTRLRDTRAEESAFEQIAQAAVNDGAMIVNPREATREDVTALLRAAW